MNLDSLRQTFESDKFMAILRLHPPMLPTDGYDCSAVRMLSTS